MTVYTHGYPMNKVMSMNDETLIGFGGFAFCATTPEHATEFAGEAMVKGILERVLSEKASPHRERLIFDLILNTNPDGNLHGWHQYNLNDWRGHNYHDQVDRSWYREFRSCIAGEPGNYSPETVAVIGWILKSRPALYISMHSWEGQFGVPGAYYTSPEVLAPEMASGIRRINELAIANATQLGFGFDPRESVADGLHLGHYLMQQGVCYAYLPDGHYNLGFDTLKKFGAGLLHDIIADPLLDLGGYDASRWDRLSSSRVKNRGNPQYYLNIGYLVHLDFGKDSVLAAAVTPYRMDAEGGRSRFTISYDPP